MRRRRSKARQREGATPPGQPELGLVSIPLLCCLLGAALYVYEYGGTEPTLTTEFLALEEDVAASSYDAAQLDQREQEAATRLRALLAAARLANLDETLAELRERFGKLQQQESDLQRLQELLEQIAAAEIEVANLERQREERERQRLSLFSGYDGPYVLVECVEDALLVHPGGQRIPLFDLAAHTDALIARIESAGHVALAVRPGGWTNNSFAEAKRIIYGHLETVRAEYGRHIARTDFPLPADESITPYLPPTSG